MSYEHIYDTEEIPLFGVTPPTRLTSEAFSWCREEWVQLHPSQCWLSHLIEDWNLKNIILSQMKDTN